MIDLLSSYLQHAITYKRYCFTAQLRRAGGFTQTYAATGTYTKAQIKQGQLYIAQAPHGTDNELDRICEFAIRKFVKHSISVPEIRM